MDNAIYSCATEAVVGYRKLNRQYDLNAHKVSLITTVDFVNKISSMIFIDLNTNL